MKKERKVVFSTRARKDTVIAYEFYEVSQGNLGDYFNLQLKTCITSILKAPEGFKVSHKNFHTLLFMQLIVIKLSSQKFYIPV